MKAQPFFNTQNKSLILKISLLFTLTLMLSLISAPKAHAITRFFPNNINTPRTSTSGDAMAIVGNPNNGGGLNAPHESFKIFRPKINNTTKNNNPMRIVLNQACGNTDYDTDKSTTDTRIKATPYYLDANGNQSGFSGQQSYQAPGGNCQGADLVFYIPAAAFSDSQYLKYGKKFETAILAVDKLTSAYGQKLFQVEVPQGAYVTFEDLGSRLGQPNENEGALGNGRPTYEAFAIHDSKKSGQAASAYTFQFTPDCTYQPGRNVYLKWSDADDHADEQNWDGNISFDFQDPGGNPYLFRRGRDSTAYWPSNYIVDLGGQGWKGAGSNTQNVGALNKGQQYTWQWHDVNQSNGVQIWMPYSEFGSLAECPPPQGPEPTCTTFNHQMAANSRYRFTVFARDGSYRTGGPPQGKTVNSAGQRTWNTYNQAPVYQVEKVSDSNGGNASFNFPSPRGPDWYVYIEAWTDTGGTPKYRYGQAVPARILNCFNAQCTSAQIVAGALPARQYGVQAGSPFILRVTLLNTGNADLPASSVGYSLAGTADGRPGPTGGGIPRGQARQTDIALTARGGIQSYTLNPYADYYGLFAMGGGCPIGINTYEPFLLQPKVNSVQANDAEDPTKITYNTNITQVTTGGYTSHLIPATSSRGLFWKRGGNSQGYLKGLDSDGQRGFANPNPTNYSDIYDNTTLPRDFRAGDDFCGIINIDHANGWIGPGDDMTGPTGVPGSASDQSCSKVVDRPYVRAYGSDVFAGGKFGQEGSASNGDIKTYIKKATNRPESGYGGGSGVEFAAYALGVIEGGSSEYIGFNTASMRSSAPAAPSGLAFASPGPGFGGRFADVHMATDYFNTTKEPETVQQDAATNAVPALNSLGDNQQSWFKKTSGKVTLGNGNNYNKHHSLYIDGDVFISDNIVYAGSGGWAKISDIPSFALYVKGNIYIKNTVSRLDGLYVAQPRDDGSGGTIYTCSNDSGGLYGAAEIYSACHTQLKVNGSFVAQNTKLLRTYGTLSDVPVESDYVPGTVSSDSIRNGVYSYAYWSGGEPARVAGRSKFVTMCEPSDNNWVGTPPVCGSSDNRFYYNSDYDLKFYAGGAGGSPSAEEMNDCVSLNSPNISPAYGWGDNYMCATPGSNLGLEMQWDLNAPDPPGKACTVLNEYYNWNNGSDWKGKFCYRNTPVTSSPSQPLQFVRETFANDHAAESFRVAPELYLARPVQQPIGSQSNGKFDQYLELPPVL